MAMTRRDLFKRTAAGLILAAGAGELLVPDDRDVQWLVVQELETYPFYDPDSPAFRRQPVTLIWQSPDGQQVQLPFIGFEDKPGRWDRDGMKMVTVLTFDQTTLQTVPRGTNATFLYGYRDEWVEGATV